MSKAQALGYAVFCVVLAFLLCVINLAVIGIFAFVGAGIFGCIWLYKYLRDQKLLADAQAAVASRPQLGPPPMTSPGSNGRLFVPPPLDRHQ